MICCYIIYSPSNDKFYIGASSEGAEQRLEKHNNNTYRDAYTSFANDWVLFLEIVCENYNQAINIEKHIKKMKSKKYIRNLIHYPEIVDRLLSKYNRI